MTRLTFNRPILLAGGGTLTPDMLQDARQVGEALGGLAAIVAADGAADALDALGARPDVIVGDLDSLGDPERWRRDGVPVLHLAEQDTTDFEKCLYSVTAPLYLAAGFTGRRTDHMLAVLHVLLVRRTQRVVLIGEEEVMALAPPGRMLRMDLGAGARVSIYPLVPLRCAPSAGLVWPVDGLTLAPGRQVGTSNIAAEDRVSLRFEDPGALLMLERHALPALVSALMADDTS